MRQRSNTFVKNDKARGLGGVSGKEITRKIKLSLRRLVVQGSQPHIPILVMGRSHFLLVQERYLPYGGFIHLFEGRLASSQGQSDLSTSAVFSNSFSWRYSIWSRFFIWGYHVLNPRSWKKLGETSGRCLDFELLVYRIERKYISVVSSHSSHLTCGSLIWPPQEGKRRVKDCCTHIPKGYHLQHPSVEQLEPRPCIAGPGLKARSP